MVFTHLSIRILLDNYHLYFQSSTQMSSHLENAIFTVEWMQTILLVRSFGRIFGFLYIHMNAHL
jgi:hypothetical protein